MFAKTERFAPELREIAGFISHDHSEAKFTAQSPHFANAGAPKT
jgi:hypothetical protein